jgi:hypothetical protein
VELHIRNRSETDPADAHALKVMALAIPAGSETIRLVFSVAARAEDRLG